MKHAEVSDNFRRMRENKCHKDIKSMKYSNIPTLGEGEILFNTSRINAFCGCNGSGKSTLMKLLTNSFSNEMNDSKFNRDSIEIVVKKASEEKSLNEYVDEFKLDYHDVHRYSVVKEKISECLKFYEVDEKELETNIKSLINGIDPRVLTSGELNDISKVVCRHYDSAKYYFVEIEEGESVPFFFVNYKGIEYTSMTMGLGEHSIFYLFYLLDQSESNSIILIEEPENFLSPKSQNFLIELLAKYSLERKYGGKNIKIILSTHSPYILRKLNYEEIRLLLREGPNQVKIVQPDSYIGYAKTLGMDINRNKIILVEDIAASIFTKIWLKTMNYYFLDEVEISIANSDEDIKIALKFPRVGSFKIFGLFDGDIKEFDDSQTSNKTKIVKEEDKKLFHHGFGYLPIRNVEEDFKKCFNLNKQHFCESFSMREEEYLITSNLLDGYDKHDWLEELSKDVSKSKENIIGSFYKIWYEKPENSVIAIEKYKEIINYFSE